MSEPDTDTATWLVSSHGVAVVDETTHRLDADDDELSVAQRLRRDGLDPARAAAAVTASVARRHARDRWPDADQLVFTREALEQASHPQVSRWRARRFAATATWDLCAGVGGDALELGVRASSLTAVELDAAKAILLRHNLEVRGLDASAVTADALEVDVSPDSLVHADPARRRDGRRVTRLRDHLPSVPELVAHHRHAQGMGIVLSPGVDLQDPDLPDAETEFIQVDDQLTEAVAWMGALRQPGARATATLLPAGHTRTRHGDATHLAIGDVGEVLVEVAPAAVRARLHDELGRELGARRLSTRRALLTSDGSPPDSPWYRVRPVVTVLPARTRIVRRWLRDHGAGPVELAFHGIAGEVERWWRELGRPPRGPDGVRVEVVRLDRGAVVVVTQAARRSGSGCAHAGHLDR